MKDLTELAADWRAARGALLDAEAAYDEAKAATDEAPAWASADLLLLERAARNAVQAAYNADRAAEAALTAAAMEG